MCVAAVAQVLSSLNRCVTVPKITLQSELWLGLKKQRWPRRVNNNNLNYKNEQCTEDMAAGIPVSSLDR